MKLALRVSLCFTGLLYSKHTFSGAVSRPAPSEGHLYPSEDLSPCHTAGRARCRVRTTRMAISDAYRSRSRTVVCYTLSFFHLQTTTAWPGERRRMLLLENNRLPFWGQLPLQTHSWSERQGQEALAAMKSACEQQTGLKESACIGPGFKANIIPIAEWTRAARRIRRQCSVCQHYMWPQKLLYCVGRTWFKTVTSSLVSIRDVTIQGSESVENQKHEKGFLWKSQWDQGSFGEAPSSLNSNTRQRCSCKCSLWSTQLLAVCELGFIVGGTWGGSRCPPDQRSASRWALCLNATAF